MTAASSSSPKGPKPPNQPHSLLKQCNSIPQLKQIHTQFTTLGLAGDALLLLLSKLLLSGDPLYAFRLFQTLPPPLLTTPLFNALIRSFSKTPKTPHLSISLYARMLRLSVPSDHLTFPFLLKSAARLSSLPLGRSLHSHAAHLGLLSDPFVANSLINLYSSCRDTPSAHQVFDAIPHPNTVSWNSLLNAYTKSGDMGTARELFTRMPDRDVVSWSALIDGYVKTGHYREALAVFETMRSSSSGPKPNEVTVVSALCACAHSGALEQGRKVHCYLNDGGLAMSLAVATSLVDMYSKCGAIGEAIRVFRLVPVGETDVLIWNAVIGGLAVHGMCAEALAMFREMESCGIEPDEITYLSLLSACAHGGLVDDAWGFFRSIEARGMRPHIEHYASMVDALGRSGRVAEAFEFVRTMPMEPSGSVLGALLNGCRTHGWVRLGEVVGRRLVELEPGHDGRYIGLSNIYALGRRWDEAKTTREVMERRGVKKAPGFSEVEVDGALHRFIAHDRTHPLWLEMCLVLSVIGQQMKLEFDSNNQKMSYL